MLDADTMEKILREVRSVVKGWRKYAKSIGIPGNDQDMMAAAFRY